MTVILHYVHSISQEEDFVKVIFREIPSNEMVLDYIKHIKSEWDRQQMPGDISLETLNQVKNSRFKNEFMMKFALHQWNQRGLRILDQVKIDMPLQLDDIKTVVPDMGV